ncbi:MAG: uroporphyrinogen-III C-methyltransferase, partial [Clostridia bacterium]|nr:uroporphyrinogen-III C-methyltransferase [Clostridia bacterium]
MANKGIVYLVGAGPGDPGLLTLRGKECLQKAEVVVYDRLVGKTLLDWIDPQAEKIYVGKSPEKHALKQEKINQLLVDQALAGKVVTRLKGGDPFVFGRGGEEAEALQAQGIPFEIVPGITSAVAVPAYAGIPVTHRGLTSTVTLITGNEDPNKADSSLNWQAISEIGGTLVFFMGMGNLSEITARLLKGGRQPETPVALIRWGTRPQQKTLLGTLQNIAALAAEAEFKNPAIILVGEVVQMREKLNWFENRPLWGQKILVTRSREQASSLSEKIRQLGGEAVEFPTIQIAPPADPLPLEQASAQIESSQWLILTSVNGVK